MAAFVDSGGGQTAGPDFVQLPFDASLEIWLLGTAPFIWARGLVMQSVIATLGQLYQLGYTETFAKWACLMVALGKGYLPRLADSALVRSLLTWKFAPCWAGSHEWEERRGSQKARQSFQSGNAESCTS